MATANPKKKKEAKKDGSLEKVTPKTAKDLAEEYMSDMLKSAGAARKSHIKLATVSYGKDLAALLLQFAEAMETLFQEMQKALDQGDEKRLESLMAKAKLKEEEGEKAKAWKAVL